MRRGDGVSAEVESVALQNPYLDDLVANVGYEAGYGLSLRGDRQFRQSNIDEWHARKQAGQNLPLKDFRYSRVQRFSWAIPNEAAITAIANCGPVVEMGAGTGYWAWMLQQVGCDVVAYDAHPPKGLVPTPAGKSKYDTDLGEYKWHRGEIPWFPVKRGYPSSLSRHSDRVLLLVWPPYASPMAADCLRHYSGSTVCFVGEDFGGCTGDDVFFEALERDFDVTEEHVLPQWWGIHDQLSIYQRKVTA